MENETLRVDMQIRADILKRDAVDQQLETFQEAMAEWLEKLEKSKLVDNAELQLVAIALDSKVNKELDDDQSVLYSKTAVDNADELLEVQRLTVETDQFKYNDYMRGMYNGMEMIVSTLEQRPPVYLNEFGKFSKREGFIENDGI